MLYHDVSGQHDCVWPRLAPASSGFLLWRHRGSKLLTRLTGSPGLAALAAWVLWCAGSRGTRGRPRYVTVPWPALAVWRRPAVASISSVLVWCRLTVTDLPQLIYWQENNRDSKTYLEVPTDEEFQYLSYGSSVWILERKQHIQLRHMLASRRVVLTHNKCLTIFPIHITILLAIFIEKIPNFVVWWDCSLFRKHTVGKIWFQVAQWFSPILMIKYS